MPRLICTVIRTGTTTNSKLYTNDIAPVSGFGVFSFIYAIFGRLTK